MNEFNSLGVRELPETTNPVNVDWNNDDIYKGDEFYIIEGELVRKDNLEEYLEFNYGGVQTA